MSVWVIEFRRPHKHSKWRIWPSVGKNFLPKKDALYVAEGLKGDKYYLWRVREYRSVVQARRCK